MEMKITSTWELGELKQKPRTTPDPRTRRRNNEQHAERLGVRRPHRGRPQRDEGRRVVTLLKVLYYIRRTKAGNLVFLVVLLMLAGCPVGPGPGQCIAPDLAGVDAGDPPCGIKSAPTSPACAWVCSYSAARGYEWFGEGCCSPAASGAGAGDNTPCGQLGAQAEPCAWRCTYDPRAGGSYQWEQLHQGCSQLDGGIHP